MPIKVTCLSCHASFKVSDKFAGKQGPCPKCKAVIRIPTLEEAAAEAPDEVVIHAPDAADAKTPDSKGRPIAKPIERVDPEFKWPLALLVFAVVAGVFGLAWYFGNSMAGTPVLKLFLSMLILAVSGPLAIAGYWFLRNPDLEAYSGMSLYVRSGIAAGVYCLLWVVLWQVDQNFPDLFEYGWNWLFIAPPLLAVGATAATLSLDLEPTEGFLHCALFTFTSIAIRWMGGISPW